MVGVGLGYGYYFFLYTKKIGAVEKPNFTYINNLSGGDADFRLKLLAVIKEEFPQERLEFESNMAIPNFMAAAQNVHKLKHKFSILGLEQSYHLADVLEEDLKHSKHDGLKSFIQILDEISAFLEQL
jgi:HPt (histidine-containing phosphotransfer) domain-containing protein